MTREPGTKNTSTWSHIPQQRADARINYYFHVQFCHSYTRFTKYFQGVPYFSCFCLFVPNKSWRWLGWRSADGAGSDFSFSLISLPCFLPWLAETTLRAVSRFCLCAVVNHGSGNQSPTRRCWPMAERGSFRGRVQLVGKKTLKRRTLLCGEYRNSRLISFSWTLPNLLSRSLIYKPGASKFSLPAAEKVFTVITASSLANRYRKA